jgi:hypothetical protein
VSQGTGTGGRHGYATALADQWYALAHTLRRLEALALDPDEATGDDLPALQYALHVAGERIAGLAPPLGAEESHDELHAALVEARDATAEVADAFAGGGLAAAEPLVWEWRGALFRVRHARSRLSHQPPPPEAEGGLLPARRRRAVETVLLCAFGVPLLVTAGLAAETSAAGWTIVPAVFLALVLGLLLRRA